jgi:hypothetical protein
MNKKSSEFRETGAVGDLHIPLSVLSTVEVRPLWHAGGLDRNSTQDIQYEEVPPSSLEGMSVEPLIVRPTGIHPDDALRGE